MTKRKTGWVVLGFLAAGWIGGMQAVSGTAATEDMCVPMGTLVLKAPEGVTSQRSAVNFPHARHFDVSCVTCHHTWGLTEPIAGCMTSGCHDVSEVPKRKAGEPVGEGAGMAYFKTAYHKLCINCHKDMKAKNLELQKSLTTASKKLPKTGPVSCSECHPK
jgi:hypothetical protein